MGSLRRSCLSFALLSASCACAGDPGPAPVVKVGGSTPFGLGFIDWSGEPHSAEVLTGPQGGQHIWISARTRNMAVTTATMAVTLLLETPTGDVLVKPGRVEMARKAEQNGVDIIYAGLPAFVKEPCKVKGQRVRVELDIRDQAGNVAADKAWITPTYTGYCDPK